MKYYRLMLWKAYFDKGYGVTSYFKYLIAFYGMSSLDVSLTMILGMFYGVSCFFIGYFWYKCKLVDAEHEVNNVVNPFIREMRDKMEALKEISKPKKILV
ncbi:hypothetical protein CMI37_38670 [Candidatus Pacearchaeota archaeon]|nr:hypothetical protein [Candidatus Pacearchaeota archaeon]|tara:strand:- start:165 stop:464 length:300 start_codon:yes stop_codon:yes gene_type:complete